MGTEHSRFRSNLLLSQAQAKNCSPEKDRIFPSIQPVSVRKIAAGDLGESESSQFLLHLASYLPRERRKERPFELRGGRLEKVRGDAAAAAALGRSRRTVMPAAGSV